MSTICLCMDTHALRHRKSKLQRKQIKLFNQAISGAPYTALSVPLSLTADSVLSHDIHNYPDNIINMANQAGFQTFWLSSQSAFRQNGTAVTSIAMRAMETVYVRGFDELLLPHLSQALQQKTQQKKLIVLHLNGSHEPACSAYPQSSAVFQPQDDQDACYDNSIHYTDSLLGQIFELLKIAAPRSCILPTTAWNATLRRRTSIFMEAGRPASRHIMSRCLSGIAPFLGMALIVQRKTISFHCVQ